MSRARVLFVALSFIVVPAFSPGAAQAQAAVQSPIAVAQLVERATEYDGAEVEIEGEIIGDLMSRGDHAWLSLLDGTTAVGVWVAKHDIPDISFLGRYSAHGDRLRIRGTMHRACPEHGGDLDIHATSVEVVEHGLVVSHPVDTRRLAAGLVLSVVGASLAVCWRRREHRVGKV